MESDRERKRLMKTSEGESRGKRKQELLVVREFKRLGERKRERERKRHMKTE